MIEAFEAADVARADARRIAAGADLMSAAAAALAAACGRELVRTRGRTSGARVVLLVGPGNNGGDALLAGALLRERGAGVTALLCSERHHVPGLHRLLVAGGQARSLGDGPSVEHTSGDHATVEQAVRLVEQADLVVDGILGIGGRGGVREPAVGLLDGLRRRPGVVVACDLPSGVDPDTGAVDGAVLAADLTVTFGVATPGLLVGPGADLVGRLQVVDLGLRPHLPAAPALLHLDQGPRSREQVASWWPWPWRRADKYARGVVAVAAGSDAYPGAAVLAVSAAVQAGAGMVRYVPPASSDGSAAGAVLAAAPEAVPDPLPDTGRVQAWVLGPGMSDPGDGRVRHVLESTDEPVVVDAGALAGLVEAVRTGRVRDPGRLLLSPHAGECARLLTSLGGPVSRAEVEAAPLQHAAVTADATGATVLLKGAVTVVAQPGGRCAAVSGAPAWLATAGSGDVLAGVAGALLAAGLDPWAAALSAAHVHAAAAALASDGGPVRALGIVAQLPRAVSALHGGGWQHGGHD